MKKYLMTLAAVLCCTMANAVFNSCEEDDDDVVAVETNAKPASAQMTCTMTVSEDLLALCDLSVEYYDADGKVQSETLTTTKWEKTVVADAFPITHGARMNAQLKEGVELTPDKTYAVNHSYSYTVRALTANGGEIGKTVKSVSGGSEQTLPMKGDKVAEWVALRGNGLMKFLVTVDADGNYTKDNWE